MTNEKDADFDRIHRLVKKGDILGLRSELDDGLQPNLTNRFGWSLLMLAALHGRTDMIDLLLSRGADPTVTNQFGDTADSLARGKGHRRITQVLEKEQ